MQNSQTSSSSHDRHDRLMVARFAAGDAYPSEFDRAKHLVESCAECASLAADIRLISARAAELPTVRRPRDFRISAAQAEQIRGSWLDRLVRWISAPGWGVVRPLASAALVVGLSLVVIGALPLGATSSPATDSGTVSSSAQLTTLLPATAGQQPPAAVTQPRATAAAPEIGLSGSVPPPNLPVGTPLDGNYASVPTNEPAAQTPPAPGAGDAAASEGNGKSTAAPTGRTSKPDEGPQTAPATPAPVVIGPAQRATAAPSAQAIVPAPQAGSIPADLLATPQPAAPVAAVAPASNDRSGLLLAGLGLAILALAVLAIVWFVRRRYSDPLIR